MEYLVTMTTQVPEGTPDATVDDVRTREAARSRELAAQGHLLDTCGGCGRCRARGARWACGRPPARPRCTRS